MGPVAADFHFNLLDQFWQLQLHLEKVSVTLMIRGHRLTMNEVFNLLNYPVKGRLQLIGISCQRDACSNEQQEVIK